jgi:hypothetical protein
LNDGLGFNFDDAFEETGEELFGVADKKVDLLRHKFSGQFD